MEKPRRWSRLTRKLRAKIRASGLPDVLSVECGELHAQLYLSKMGSGTRGPSIEWDGMWLTPSQFEEMSGFGSVRNWKRNIRYENRSLNCYVKVGLIQLHKRYCDCVRCITPLLKIGNSHPAKAKYYGRKYDDQTPDGIGDGNEDEFDASCDDSLLMKTSPSQTRRQYRKGSSVQFVDVNESGYVTLTGSVPTTDMLTDQTEAGVECLSTYVSPPGFSNGTRTNEGHRWQATCGAGDKLTVDRQVLARYLHGNDKDGQNECGALAAVEANRRSLPRIGCATREVGVRAEYKSELSPGKGSQLKHSKTHQHCSKPPTRKGRARETLIVSPRTVHRSSDYCFSRGSVPAGTAGYAGSKTSKARQKKNTTLPQSERHSTKSKQEFGTTDLYVAHESTVNERLDEVINKAGLADDNVSSWSVDQVASFVDAAGFPFQSSLFREQLINGEALMTMRERHLIDHLKLKLGPSLRLFALVRGLQSKLA